METSTVVTPVRVRKALQYTDNVPGTELGNELEQAAAVASEAAWTNTSWIVDVDMLVVSLQEQVPASTTALASASACTSHNESEPG